MYLWCLNITKYLWCLNLKCDQNKTKILLKKAYCRIQTPVYMVQAFDATHLAKRLCWLHQLCDAIKYMLSNKHTIKQQIYFSINNGSNG